MYRIGDIARFTNRTPFAIREAERLGRIPKARRDYRGFRYWTDNDLQAICAAFGASLPPTATERLWQESLALLGSEPAANLEDAVQQVQRMLAPAVKAGGN